MTDDINEDTDALAAYKAGRDDGTKEGRESSFWKGFACGMLASFAIFALIALIIMRLI